MSSQFDDALGAFIPHFLKQGPLAVYGIFLLALVPMGLLWSRLDQRIVNGESVATKPTRFLLSIGVHAVTLSWMFNFVRLERVHALVPTLAVWGVLISSTWEIACIGWQAARGRQSHFNRSTPRDSAIFASMGIFATLLVAANLPLAWEIAHRPVDGANPVMVLAVLAGLLVSCFVGGGTGVLMGMRNRHGIGREGRRLPVLGWSSVAGDLRPSHFLSIHALQAFPLLAAVAMLLAPGDAQTPFGFATVGYLLLIGATLIQAINGHPIVPAAVRFNTRT